jgi:hypothetical protein
MLKILRHLNLALLIFLSSQILAAGTYEYPELQVRPLATQRIKMQAIKEHKRGWVFQPSMQISAAMTFSAGILQYGNVEEADDTKKISPVVGTIIGASWLGVNYFVGQHMKVYRSALREIKAMPNKTATQKLVRERMAEEAINRAAKLENRMKWISVATNAGANLFMLSKVEKDTTSEVFNVASLAASLAPLLFNTDWRDIAKNQRRYKKRIYGPILTTSVFNVGKNIAPGALFSFSF